MIVFNGKKIHGWREGELQGQHNQLSFNERLECFCRNAHKDGLSLRQAIHASEGLFTESQVESVWKHLGIPA